MSVSSHSGVRALLPTLLVLLTGCPDEGSHHVNWSQYDRPAPPDPLDAEVPPDGGDAGDAAEPAPMHADVLVQNIAFSPMSVRIAVGGTVTWQNLDLVQHDIRSGTPSVPTTLFNSGLMDRGSTFTWQFDTPGIYEYYCSTHANVMLGATVEVVE